MDPAAKPVPAASAFLPRLDAALTLVGVRGPLARDAVLAGLVALASLAVALPVLGPVATHLGVTLSAGQRAAVLLLVTTQALLLVLRRSRPGECLLAVALLQVAINAVLPLDTGVRLAAPIIAAYSLGAYRPTRRALRILVAALAAEVVGGAVVEALIAPVVRSLLVRSDAAGPANPAGPAGSYVLPLWLVGQLLVVLLYLGATLAGLVVASQRRYTALVDAQAAAAAAQEQDRLHSAVAAERSRMARELHDIAAHHLSGLIVQAGAAERLVDRDPEAAKQATRSVRSQGKEALTNLRSLVGVLREPRTAPSSVGAAGLDAESGAPIPGLAVLDRLLDAARASGDDLDVNVDGQPQDLPPLVDVTVYRILQEALANARQHAPGRAVRVLLEQNPAHVVLEVSNDVVVPAHPSGAVRRPGYGLVGMRERAQLSGATFSAQQVAGRWHVRLAVSCAPGPTLVDERAKEESS